MLDAVKRHWVDYRGFPLPRKTFFPPVPTFPSVIRKKINVPWYNVLWRKLKMFICKCFDVREFFVSCRRYIRDKKYWLQSSLIICTMQWIRHKWDVNVVSNDKFISHFYRQNLDTLLFLGVIRRCNFLVKVASTLLTSRHLII